MKIKNVIVVIVLISAVGLGWLYLQKNKPVITPGHQHADLYYCPMHPQVTSDKPGNCPICHMKLVKREEADMSSKNSQMPSNSGKDYASVMIDSRKQQL